MQRCSVCHGAPSWNRAQPPPPCTPRRERQSGCARSLAFFDPTPRQLSPRPAGLYSSTSPSLPLGSIHHKRGHCLYDWSITRAYESCQRICVGDSFFSISLLPPSLSPFLSLVSTSTRDVAIPFYIPRSFRRIRVHLCGSETETRCGFYL